MEACGFSHGVLFGVLLLSLVVLVSFTCTSPGSVMVVTAAVVRVICVPSVPDVGVRVISFDSDALYMAV